MHTATINPRAAATPPPPEPEKVDLPPVPAALQVNAAHCQVNSAGFAFKTMFVRLPKGMVAEDLKRPEIWQSVQVSERVSLRKFDELTIVSYDEDWLATGIVVEARDSGVQLGLLKVVTVPPRYDKLLETDDFRIGWIGHGYAVIRKVDGQIMSRGESSPALAERRLRDLSPAKAR